MLASGNTMMLAPTMNILRHPAWGRAQETYGEDAVPARAGSAPRSCRACSSTPPRAPSTTRPTTSRTAASSANAQMDEQTLREIYARHFEMIIRDGGVSCVMARTTWSTARQVRRRASTCSNDILRDDFGFKGFVLVRLVGDAERQQRAAPVRERAAADRAARRCRPAWIWSCPGDTTTRRCRSLVTAGRCRRRELVTASAAHPRAEVSLQGRQDRRALGLKAPFTTYDSNASIANNDREQPGDRHEPHRRSPSRRRSSRWCCSRTTTTRCRSDRRGDEDRRASARAVAYSTSRRAPGQLQNRRLSRSTSRPTSAPATSARSRVFSDPGEGHGPVRRHRRPPPARRHRP